MGRRPRAEGLVAVDEDAGMLRLIAVTFIDAKFATDLVNILLGASQEIPAGFGLERFGIFFQDGRCVDRWVNRYGQHHHVTAEVLTELILEPGEIRRGPRAIAGAASIEEIDQ